MSKFNSREGFAAGIIATGLVLLTVHLFLVFSHPNEKSTQTDCNTGSQCDSQNKGSTIPPDNTFWHWDGWVVSSAASAAQWIMTAFTIIAAVLLYMNLQSANATNDEAIKANKETIEANRIARAQQRPWVTLEWQIPCEFLVKENGVACIRWNYQFVNRGFSPANNVRLTYGVFRYHTKFVGAGRKGIEISIERAINRQRNGGQLIFHGDRTDFGDIDQWNLIGRITGDNHEGGTYFLCYCLMYDLDGTGIDFGYEAGALMMEELDGGAFHPFGTNLKKFRDTRK